MGRMDRLLGVDAADELITSSGEGVLSFHDSIASIFIGCFFYIHFNFKTLNILEIFND